MNMNKIQAIQADVDSMNASAVRIDKSLVEYKGYFYRGVSIEELEELDVIMDMYAQMNYVRSNNGNNIIYKESDQ